ncbi:MAG: 4-(cytidine 5'-diphospho)-2-C-methyl-D-erythritol kinase, partial [Gammaproteobacteria bacterium]|nr:4-(cytidine 5'-diphospho)-2-C-methyl-D-erythritol kinase [Gammaproteobacteria bacterium]
GCKYGTDINVTKRIPIGGGLGGGSSNAATSLIALNRLWSLHLPLEQLTDLGLLLGADIPVFLYGHSAWAEGIGEILTSFEPEKLWYLVINPGCHVPTAEIFNARELTRNTPAITIRDFLVSGGHNDCETVVRERFPLVSTALDWLLAYGDARLTGSG